MLAIYGTIDHVSNYVLQITILYNDQMYKCESINVTTFTFHIYELNTSNYYDPL